MSLTVLVVWLCNLCGAVSNDSRPRGWTWFRSGKEIRHRCASCEMKCDVEHRGVMLGRDSSEARR